VLRLLPLPKRGLEWVRRQWTLRPQIIDGRCTHCGICEKGCPVKPAAIHPNAPPTERLEDDRCIRCYCCHEFCPSQALELRAPWLVRHLPLEKLANGASRFIGFFASARGVRK
jgi:ferredoxin